MGKKATTTGDGRRWRQWTEQEARAALEELSSSGRSPAEFARSKGVSTHRLAYWKKRLADGGAPAFVSLALPRAAAPPRRGQWVDIVVGGVVVRLPEDVEAERVAGIVEALSRRSGRC
jgi:transposase-like protein